MRIPTVGSRPPGPFTLWAYIWPRTPAKGRQGILTRWQDANGGGYALGIGAGGALEFRVGDGAGNTDALTADIPLIARQWYLVAASYDPSSGEAALYQEPVENRYNNHLSKIVPIARTSHARGRLAAEAAAADADFLWAAAGSRDDERGAFATHLYNGKIDRAGVAGAVLDWDALDRARAAGGAPETDAVIAAWDTTAGYSDTGIGDTIVDTGPHGLHGEGINRPVRGMTGFNWTGHDDCFRHAPAQFGGIEFHEDALADCGWVPTLSMELPDVKSGVYAARLTAGDTAEHVVFFLRPKEPTAPIAMLMPTCSYLAYANERIGLDTGMAQVLSSQVTVIHEWDVALRQRPEYGLSCYDSHRDGAGVCYSTRRRPIFNMRPKHRMAPTVVPWQFPADLSIIYWLETMGYDYDVITDEDLHQEGSGLPRALQRRHQRHPCRVLFRGHDGRDGGLSRLRRQAHVPLRQRLLLGRLLPRGRHGRDGGAAPRLGHPLLERRARRALHGEQRGARRPLARGAGGRPRSSWAPGSPPRAWTSPSPTARCRMPRTRRPPGSSRASTATLLAMRAWPWAAPPASSSTATTSPSAPRRTR